MTGPDFREQANYTSSSPDEESERTHNFANEIEAIGGVLPFAYDAAGNMAEQGLPAATTKYYEHDAWNRLTEVRIGGITLGEYEYNALHWRTVKRSRSPGAGGLDKMRLMYYSANWQLLEQRIDRQWSGSGFTEDERAQTFWGKRYIDDGAWASRPRSSASRDANGQITFEAPVPPAPAGERFFFMPRCKASARRRMCRMWWRV